MDIKTVDINGWPIEYIDSGETGAPPLLLLSGWAQDHRLFRHVEPYLAQRFRVIRMNFRGHDAKLTPGDFTSADLADDTVEFIDRLGLRNVAIASTSHGCWVNIEVHEKLGSASLGRTVVIDWLLRPFEAFHKQIHDGSRPETVTAARQSLFDEWTEGTDVLDVLDHVNREMTWFGEDMWMRACREIAKSYNQWQNPLERMSELADRLRVTHIYSQPLDPGYRQFQQDYAGVNPWFSSVHIPAKTHFPTLESPKPVADAIASFYS
ncbi:alpha/beta fold hydrolase [Enemella evansiae]|uniref:alpha/beta fold hydrolase n=1 Tax=Enemella evansiae TaxID=2016499 RepID=UPI000B96CDCB|nr:alpha/beta hydrolase [Enemella evansiae]OYO06664.1 3-hydroxy-4-oxoquinoline 2,4-dioxygenase [Enemella evansiae]